LKDKDTQLAGIFMELIIDGFEAILKIMALKDICNKLNRLERECQILI